MHTKQKKVIWNSQHGFTEDLGALVGDQGDHELTACHCGQEGQWYSGVHQEKCGQQIEGADPASLLS